MRSDAKLVRVSDVRSIMRTSMCKMILELKLDKERKGTAYKRLVEVVGEGVEVRALTRETTLKVKILDEFTEVEELIMELRKQCDVQVA